MPERLRRRGSLLRLRRALRLDRRDDRGAVAVLIAILAGTGVLLGLAALVVDVGNLYAEREQLQSGADAAVVALAQQCAVGGPDCSSGAGALGIAGAKADANAADSLSGATVVCGRGGSLSPCPAPDANLTACLSPAPGSGDYVEVRTATEEAGGSTLLPPTFAQAVVSGYSGTTVAACARAAWGSPGSARLSLATSICEWMVGTNSGAAYPDPAADRILYLRQTPPAGTCQPDGAGGPTAPGGFGWLTDPGRNCLTPVVVGGSYLTRTRSGVSSACRNLLTTLRSSGEPVLMPVYDTITGTGTSAVFHIRGVAAFVVTGWNLSFSARPSTLTGQDPCASNGHAGTCIYGYYTRTLVPGTATLGGPDLGAHVVALIG